MTTNRVRIWSNSSLRKIAALLTCTIARSAARNSRASISTQIQTLFFTIIICALSGCVDPEHLLNPRPQTPGELQTSSSCEALNRRRQEYVVAGQEREASTLAEQIASCTRREYRESPLDATKAAAYEDARKRLAELYIRSGDYDRAALVAKDLVQGPEQCLHDCVGAFDILIEAYARQKRYGELLPLLEERLARMQQVGANVQTLAGTELQMSEALNGTKQYQRALDIAQRALKRLEAAGGTVDPELKARLLLASGKNLIRLGRFGEANLAHDLARVLISQNPRAYHSIFAEDIENVRNYYHRSRDFGRAQQFDELLQSVSR